MCARCAGEGRVNHPPYVGPATPPVRQRGAQPCKDCHGIGYLYATGWQVKQWPEHFDFVQRRYVS